MLDKYRRIIGNFGQQGRFVSNKEHRFIARLLLRQKMMSRDQPHTSLGPAGVLRYYPRGNDQASYHRASAACETTLINPHPALLQAALPLHLRLLAAIFCATMSGYTAKATDALGAARVYLGCFLRLSDYMGFRR